MIKTIKPSDKGKREILLCLGNMDPVCFNVIASI